MSSLLERSLDDIIGEKTRRSNKKPSRGGRVGKAAHSGRPFRPSGPRRTGYQGKPNEIKITNLHPELTNEDLFKLMNTVGPTVDVDIKFNTHGKSTGIAYVIFRHPKDAQRAIENFNGRLAAGQTIRVASTLSLDQRINPVPQQPAKKQNKKKNPKPEHVRKPRKTLEDLDDELNSYMNGDIPVDDAPVVDGLVSTSETAQTEAPHGEAPTPSLSEVPTENVNVIVPAFESTEAAAPSPEPAAATGDVAMD